MTRKIFSLILSVFLVAGQSAVFSAKNRVPVILLNETYNTYATNETPSGASGRVVWRTGSDKQLLLSGVDETFTNTYMLSKASKLVTVEFSLSKCADASGSVSFAEGTTKSFVPIIFSEDGSMTTTDGKRIPVSGGKYVKLGITLDVKNKQFSVYADGKCVLPGWYNSNISLAQIDSFKIEISSGLSGDTQLIDDVRAYEGREIFDYSVFPKPSVNMEEIEYIPIAEEEVGNTVFMNVDFEAETGPFSPLAITAKENLVEIRYDKTRDSKYAYMKRTVEDPFYDYNVSGQTRYMVFESDVRMDLFATTVALFAFKELNGVGDLTTVSVTATGLVRTFEGKSIIQLEKGKWYTFAMAVDFNKKTYNFYVNGEMVLEKEPLYKRDMAELTTCRMHMFNGTGDTDLFLDNYRIYEAKEPIDINSLPKPEAKSAYPSDEPIIKLLSGFVGLNTKSGNIHYNGQKIWGEAVSVVENGEVFAPVRAIADAFGLDVSVNDNIVKIGDDISLPMDNENVTVKGKAVKLSHTPYVKDSKLLIPLKSFVTDVLGKKYYYDGKELVIIGSTLFNNEKSVQSISDYLLYARPNKEKIIDLYEKETAGQRPRILMTADDLAGIKVKLENKDEIAVRAFEQIRANSEKLLTQPPENYYIPDGLRLLETSRRVLKRIEDLSMTYLITKDTKYADRAWVELEHVSKYQDWNAYTHFLDASEMSAAFAIGYDWLHDYLSDEQKAIMRKAMLDFGIIPAYNSHYKITTASGFWITADHNWNTVCNGGTSNAAIAILDDLTDEKEIDLCYDTIVQSIRSLEYSMISFAPDGAWFEGPGYWSYTMDYAVRMFTGLDNAFKTDFGLSKVQGFDKTGEFVIHLDGMNGTNNFHDAGSGHVNASMLTWMAKKFNDADLGALRYSAIQLYGFTPTLYDLMWFDKSYEEKIVTLPMDAKFAATEALAHRGSWTDTSKMYLSAHGGATDVNHYHVDGGSFILDALGVRWALDLGGEDYNVPGYFGNQRNEYYRVRAESHNTLVIDPDQSPGQEMKAFAPIVKFESKPRGGFSSIDMTSYYPSKVSSAERGYKLDDNRKSAVIRDEVMLKGKSDVYWFMTTGEEVIIEDDHVILKSNTKKLRLDYLSNVPVEVGVMDAVPLPTSPNPATQNKNVNFRKIFIKASTSGKYNLTVKFTPVDEADMCTPIDDTPIASWTIPDGELKAPPVLDNINLNGEKLKGFASGIGYYTINVLPEDTMVPEITATAQDNIKVNVIKAKDLTDRTKIELSYIDDPNNKAAYYIDFNVMKNLDPVAGMQRIRLANVVASDNPEPENTEKSAIDGELGTRWAAEGDGQWLELEFVNIETVDAITVACFNGNARKTLFSLYISMDGENYEKVFEGESSGTTNDYEIYEVGGKQAKFVKLIGKGNTVNGWNSITEFGALKR